MTRDSKIIISLEDLVKFCFIAENINKVTDESDLIGFVQKKVSFEDKVFVVTTTVSTSDIKKFRENRFLDA